MRPTTEVLDSFDYVVVLMLENRSFDNLLGYLYPDHPPAGKTFEGVVGRNLSNPIPASAVGQSAPPPGVTSIPVSPVSAPTNYHQPFPDPGEEYGHVNTQLFSDGNDKPPYLPNPLPTAPTMTGFVTDYIANFPPGDTHNGAGPTYQQYQSIMQCFPTASVPVLATHAEQFAVFDHWFCSVPSQTWCNRAFWHAGTSWGVLGARHQRWRRRYEQRQLLGRQHRRDAVQQDLRQRLALAAGLAGVQQPCFWMPHNDQHPFTWDSGHYGPDAVGTVLLGEELIWSVYNAIKNSTGAGGGNSWPNTLLIITHDEHGGVGLHRGENGRQHPARPHLVSQTMFEKWSRYITGPLTARDAAARRLP